ncbi:RNA polymerase sigma factor FliA [Ampullimonas aquatilis]|uniref:RNA polymerase sigma factor FliA n=1 Tax=Ampullimonas aquatilis TaxID=1341549 RepID=UPI003C750C17
MYNASGVLDRSQYVNQYAPLVKRMAHHILARLPPSVQLDDLVQAGLIGLMDAVNRYEESQGAQFETYATQRIRGAILDELRANDWLPRGLRKSQRDIESAIHKMEHKLGRAPTESEVAKHMKISLEEYQDLLGEARGYQLVYFDDMKDRDSDEDYHERHSADSTYEPLEQVKDARFKQALVKAIDDLPEREKQMMGMYYEQDMNFREIAAVLGVTESRVCQIHSQSIARLRSKLKDW